MPQTAQWLSSLGLSEYENRFAENDIDVSVLRDLTDQDLKKIGVSLGHRRKMLAAIAELVGAAPDSNDHRDQARAARQCRAPPAYSNVLRLGRLNGAINAHGP